MMKNKEPKLNIFDDEQGTGHFRATSDPEEKLIQSEKSLTNVKESFESGRTTNNLGSRFDSEERRISKDIGTENTETRDDEK